MELFYIFETEGWADSARHIAALVRDAYFTIQMQFLSKYILTTSAQSIFIIHNAQECTIGSKASSAHLNNRLLITDNSKQNIVQIRKLSA